MTNHSLMIILSVLFCMDDSLVSGSGKYLLPLALPGCQCINLHQAQGSGQHEQFTTTDNTSSYSFISSERCSSLSPEAIGLKSHQS